MRAGGEESRARARAVPDAGRVPAPRAGAERRDEMQAGLGLFGGGDPAAGPDRLPEARDLAPALEEVGLEMAELRLPDTKTGPRRVALSPRALRVLKGLPRLPDSPWVIPGMVAGRPMRNIDEAWGVVCELAGLTDTRIHDCRHSFASRALALGENLR